MLSQDQSAKKCLFGFWNGMLATVPMTLWMLIANKAIPSNTPDPLPPEEITHNLIQKAGPNQFLAPKEKRKASLFNHFLYGGISATPLALIRNRQNDHHPISMGVSYGLLLWISNYLGLLPILDLYPPATREPRRMNGIMIVAHVIWGGALGWLLCRKTSSYQST
jgi:hypothetical protein